MLLFKFLQQLMKMLMVFYLHQENYLFRTNTNITSLNLSPIFIFALNISEGLKRHNLEKNVSKVLHFTMQKLVKNPFTWKLEQDYINKAALKIRILFPQLYWGNCTYRHLRKNILSVGRMQLRYPKLMIYFIPKDCCVQYSLCVFYFFFSFPLKIWMP